MAYAHTHLSTDTGADLLTYESYHDLETNDDRLTRVATANEDWVVRAKDDEFYCIRFGLSFSKKHLFTFVKNDIKTESQTKIESQKPGQSGKDRENWDNAAVHLLLGKIKSTLARILR